jgi:hypothetical protein
MRREKIQINKIKNAKGELTIKPRKFIRDYFENLYSNKLADLEKMEKFLDTCVHTKLNQKDTNQLNRSLTSKKI